MARKDEKEGCRATKGADAVLRKRAPANFFRSVFSPSLVKKRLDIVAKDIGQEGCGSQHSGGVRDRAGR